MDNVNTNCGKHAKWMLVSGPKERLKFELGDDVIKLSSKRQSHIQHLFAHQKSYHQCKWLLR